ncbi:hypothetical protein EVAR_66786_1 [Eumeta japonica]|uniref:Uncharacterized protein n=1 Tax=Eumeta variegata TaxID=151549 RepID=A0A4C1ZP24_EUMVA|nr:hypothetical protein EVAR_66786_1 [Eumeta japonica]
MRILMTSLGRDSKQQCPIYLRDAAAGARLVITFFPRSTNLKTPTRQRAEHRSRCLVHCSARPVQHCLRTCESSQGSRRRAVLQRQWGLNAPAHLRSKIYVKLSLSE